MKIKTYIESGCYVPQKAHTTDAGFDIRTPIEVVVEPRSSAVIDTGVHMEIPEGYVGMLKSKSGLNVKSGILSEGVIDAGLREVLWLNFTTIQIRLNTLRKAIKSHRLLLCLFHSLNLRKWIIWANLKRQNVVPTGLVVVGDKKYA